MSAASWAAKQRGRQSSVPFMIWPFIFTLAMLFPFIMDWPFIMLPDFGCGLMAYASADALYSSSFEIVFPFEFN